MDRIVTRKENKVNEGEEEENKNAVGVVKPHTVGTCGGFPSLQKAGFWILGTCVRLAATLFNSQWQAVTS